MSNTYQNQDTTEKFKGRYQRMDSLLSACTEGRANPNLSQLESSIGQDYDLSREFSYLVGWLNRATNFSNNFVLSVNQAKIGDNMFDRLFLQPGRRHYKLNEKRREFNLFCSNLIASELRKKPIRAFLSRNTWASTRYTVAGYFTIEKNGIISTLEDAGLINIERGNEKVHRCSRIWPTPEFLKYFLPLEHVSHVPVELVVLRDDNGYGIEYPDTAQTRRIRSILERANKVNSKHRVVYTGKNGHEVVLGTYLHAVFNGDFKHGGRLYTGGSNGYQFLKRKFRRTIHIDGKPTVELDFSGCQPRILYALKGIQFNDDPYTIVYPDPELRNMLKQIFLPMLNALTKRRAILSTEYEFKEILEFQSILKMNNISIKNIVEQTIERHAPIADDFFNNAGKKAMYYDSQIALMVIEHFTSKKIPILAVHDSFIVKREFEQELREVMDRSYSKIMGGFSCKIDKKN